MILVDSSVLIDYLRTKDRKIAQLFQTLPVAVCGATRAEILAGTRTARDRQRLIYFLDQFHQMPMPESLWDVLGDNLAILYASGSSVPFPDALVASLAIEGDIEVWARDLHFPVMQKSLTRLKLFQEPP